MASHLLTLAETTDFRETGRIDEVDRLCAALSAEWPDAVRSFEFGRSAEGRAMRALVATRSGAMTPEELQQRRIPILMLQAGIHPGESDGKDAGFIALREMLAAPGKNALERIAILFVPAFNTDGHERVGRWNRPNQNGPEVTGWRATAQNLNLNRDYAKADTPEMRALLALVDLWDPLICADLHVTDGADFEPDISLQVEPINQGDPALWQTGLELRDALLSRLERQGALPLPFYPDFAETDNPASGFLLTVYSPRFSTGYFPQRNRFTVLVETHSWKPYARRVQITRNTIVGLAELTAERGSEWLAKTRLADLTAAGLGGSALTLDYKSGWREPAAAGKTSVPASEEKASLVEFRGYSYTRNLSPISGAAVTVYDSGSPQIWRVPYRSRIEATIVVQAPELGYIVPHAYADEIVPRLLCHGIEVAPLPERFKAGPVEQFRASCVSFSSGPFEGRMRASIGGTWQTLDREIADFAQFVPIAQPLARLVAALLEPQAPDSFAAWGFFNACFEQKEHLEPYVAEQVARAVLEENPTLREPFERRLRDDAKFSADPNARLEFFTRHHTSWDERLNCYPILRI
jgi:murein tripeptide amidase MpaA